MKNLILRLATAAVLVPVLLVVIYLDPSVWTVWLFATIWAVVAYDEYLRMALAVDPKSPLWAVRLPCAIAGVLLMLMPCLWPKNGAGSMLGVLIGVLGLLVVTLMRPRTIQQAGRHISASLSGLLYVPLLMSLLPLIKLLTPQGPDWVTVTLALAFLTDTGAYLAGRLFGRHKLYPQVSPGKTWEGSVGGLVGGLVATVGMGTLWRLPELPISHAVVLGVVGSIMGQLGDLVESLLKRAHGVKDSSNLLPGHGGLLDRVDGLMFVAPVVYVYLLLMSL